MNKLQSVLMYPLISGHLYGGTKRNQSNFSQISRPQVYR